MNRRAFLKSTCAAIAATALPVGASAPKTWHVELALPVPEIFPDGRFFSQHSGAIMAETMNQFHLSVMTEDELKEHALFIANIGAECLGEEGPKPGDTIYFTNTPRFAEPVQWTLEG